MPNYPDLSSKESRFSVGDKVKLREDVLQRHARSIPARFGYIKEQIQWRDVLRKLEGKIGKIQRTFPNSNHVNVKFPDGELIGIEDSEIELVK